jgi:hypothetical protein
MADMFAIPFLGVSASRRRVGGCAEAPHGFSIIINVTVEKLPYLDWGSGEHPPWFFGYFNGHFW